MTAATGKCARSALRTRQVNQRGPHDTTCGGLPPGPTLPQTREPRPRGKRETGERQCNRSIVLGSVAYSKQLGPQLVENIGASRASRLVGERASEQAPSVAAEPQDGGPPRRKGPGACLSAALLLRELPVVVFVCCRFSLSVLRAFFRRRSGVLFVDFLFFSLSLALFLFVCLFLTFTTFFLIPFPHCPYKCPHIEPRFFLLSGPLGDLEAEEKKKEREKERIK